MGSNYPNSPLDTFATNKGNSTPMINDHAAHHNDLADAINKIEAELGINPSGASATVAARFSAAAQVSFESYGAVGDGTTDDTVAIQAAITAANAAGGGEAVGTSGHTYKTFSPINLLSGVTVDLRGSTVDTTGFTYQEGAAFQATGTRTASGSGYQALTATANEHDQLVSVAAGTGGINGQFADGDFVFVGSTDQFDSQNAFGDGEIGIAEVPTCTVLAMTNSATVAQTGITMFKTAPTSSSGVFPDSGTIQIDNEQMTYTSHAQVGNGVQFQGLTRGVNGTTAAAHVIHSVCRLVVPDTEVWLRWPLQGGPYSSGPRIQKLSMVQRVGVRNGRIYGGGQGSANTGVSFKWAAQCRAENLRLDGNEVIGVDFQHVYDGVAINNHIDGSRFADGNNNLGYGVRVVNSSQEITVAFNTIRSCRHGAAMGSDTEGGIPRRVRYIGNNLMDISGDAFDTHSPTDQVDWVNNTVTGCSAGILLNGPRMRCIGNRINHAGGSAILLANNTNKPTQWEIANNRVVQPFYYGIQAVTNIPRNPQVDFISITDNVFYNCSYGGIYLYAAINKNDSPISQPYNNLTITGNTVNTIGAASSYHAIDVRNGNYCAIAHNVLLGLRSGNCGINLVGIAKSAITGNVIRSTDTTGVGIKLLKFASSDATPVDVGSIDNTVTGNTVSNAATGISVADAASTNNVLMGNNVRGCTTPITDTGSSIKSTADASGAYNRT